MEHLADVTAEELRAALDDASDATAAKRLTAAIAYKHGTTQTELAEWFGVERRTIYAWLTRLDGESLAESARNERRSGRPPKLDRDERTRLTEALREAPTASGYDAGSWTPELVRRHVRERYDVEYSLPSCRRLLEAAGLRYLEPGPPSSAGAVDGDDEEAGANGGKPNVEGDADGVPGRQDGVWLPQ